MAKMVHLLSLKYLVKESQNSFFKRPLTYFDWLIMMPFESECNELGISSQTNNTLKVSKHTLR